MFSGTFSCVQSTGGFDNGEARHLIALRATGSSETWNGPVDGVIQLGKLPPGVAHDFKLGGSYKVTIEPICEEPAKPCDNCAPA